MCVCVCMYVCLSLKTLSKHFQNTLKTFSKTTSRLLGHVSKQPKGNMNYIVMSSCMQNCCSQENPKVQFDVKLYSLTSNCTFGVQAKNAVWYQTVCSLTSNCTFGVQRKMQFSVKLYTVFHQTALFLIIFLIIFLTNL